MENIISLLIGLLERILHLEVGIFGFFQMGENIPVSSATHYIAGLTYETKDYLFSAEGYYKKLDGLSEYSLRYNTSLRELDYSENFYNGSGYTRGIEFLAQKKFGKNKRMD